MRYVLLVINIYFPHMPLDVKNVTISFSSFSQEVGMQMEEALVSGTHSPIREETEFSRTRLVM
jgi:hypothetical protein